MTATIRIAHADGRVGEIDLPFGTYDVGRDRGYIVLGDPLCSAAHAQLQVHPGGVTVVDVGSANGTFDADGSRMSTPTPMQIDRPITLGGSRLVLLRFFAPSGGTMLASTAGPAFAAPIAPFAAPVAAPAVNAQPPMQMLPQVGWTGPGLPATGRPAARSRGIGLVAVAVALLAALTIGVWTFKSSPPSEEEAKAAFVKAAGGGAIAARIIGKFTLHGCKASDKGGYACDFSTDMGALSARFIESDAGWTAILNNPGL